MSVRVQFVLTDDEYRILTERVESKGISISKYVKDKVFSGEEEIQESFKNIWDEFCEKVKTFPSNIEFNVAIVMTQQRWSTLDRSTKLSLAKLFNKNVADGEFPNIELVGRSSSNVSLYIKIK